MLCVQIKPLDERGMISPNFLHEPNRNEVRVHSSMSSWGVFHIKLLKMRHTLFSPGLYYVSEKRGLAAGVTYGIMTRDGEVSELADEHDLGSCVARRTGSTPVFPNEKRRTEVKAPVRRLLLRI